jgi:cytochrome c biogenesis protein
VISVFAAIGMTVQQLPSFAFRSQAAYVEQMALIHVRYEPLVGVEGVQLLERIGVFNVFTSWWFSLALVVLLISIVACTLDRTPRLVTQVRDIRVVQPDPYFDTRLPDRAALTGIADATVGPILRRHHFRLRTETAGDGTTYLYGDRHRYTKLATLLTHLGLILFLVAAAVTSRFGTEVPLVAAVGETATVQPIGTPGLLIVKNLGFEAPRLPDGQFADFVTDLAVYQSGQELARKQVRVNDPLSVAGFSFHQNGFGPAPDIEIRDRAGDVLWTGPVALTSQSAGLPFGTMSIPGRDVGLELYLRRDEITSGASLLALPYIVTGDNADGTPQVRSLFPILVAPGETRGSPDLDVTVTFRDVGAFSVLIAKQDPGQGIVWFAFGCLILGLAITFYLPRRRIWARVTPDGEMRIVGRADRYVDFEREFDRLLEDLAATSSAARRPAS